MKLVKCPRCDLNYIQEGEKYCKVCIREIKGEQTRDDVELCSICNEAPAMPGKDVCLMCYNEMNGRTTGLRSDIDTEETVDGAALGIDSVSTMDEIVPEIEEDIPPREYGEIESELSLEKVMEDESDEDEDEEEDEDTVKPRPRDRKAK